MELWHLFIPGIIYCGFVLGIIVLWVRQRNKVTKWNEDDERALRAYFDQHN